MLVVPNFILEKIVQGAWIYSSFESPQNELVCLLRREDRRFTTAKIFPQQVQFS
jgi:hypothetical protein